MRKHTIAQTAKLYAKYPVLNHATITTRVYVPSKKHAGSFGEITGMYPEGTNVNIVVKLEGQSDECEFRASDLVYRIRPDIYVHSNMKYHVSRETTRFESEDLDRFYTHFAVRLHSFGSQLLRVTIDEEVSPDGSKSRYLLGSYNKPEIYGDVKQLELLYSEKPNTVDLDKMIDLVTLPAYTDAEHIVVQLAIHFRDKDITSLKEVSQVLEEARFLLY